MPKADNAAEDTGAPETAPEAAVADAPPATAGDDSTSAVVTITRAELAERLSEVVKKWKGAHFYNSPISRATLALNYLNLTAVPDLEAMILKEIC